MSLHSLDHQGSLSFPFLFAVSFRVTPSWTSCQRTWSLVQPGGELRVSRLFQGAHCFLAYHLGCNFVPSLLKLLQQLFLFKTQQHTVSPSSVTSTPRKRVTLREGSGQTMFYHLLRRVPPWTVCTSWRSGLRSTVVGILLGYLFYCGAQ